MKKYAVHKNNNCIGHVEAMNESLAVDVAYATWTWEPRDALSLHRNSGAGMHLIVDTTNNRAIARHDSYQALAALAVIQFANVDTQIIRMGENKGFAVFDIDQLMSIAASVEIELPRGGKYSDHIKVLRSGLEAAEWLALPFTTEQLEAQAYAINPQDDKPYAFDPAGDKPKLLRAWHFEPQRNRKRIDSSFGHCFSAGLGYGAGVAAPPPPTEGARTQPSAPKTARSKPGATPAAPKPPKAPSGPVTRPKSGTSTGKVWDHADAIHGSGTTDLKELKKAVVAKCEADGINPSTAAVQFSKWKSSKGL